MCDPVLERAAIQQKMDLLHQAIAATSDPVHQRQLYGELRECIAAWLALPAQQSEQTRGEQEHQLVAPVT